MMIALWTFYFLKLQVYSGRLGMESRIAVCMKFNHRGIGSAGAKFNCFSKIRKENAASYQAWDEWKGSIFNLSQLTTVHSGNYNRSSVCGFYVPSIGNVKAINWLTNWLPLSSHGIAVSCMNYMYMSYGVTVRQLSNKPVAELTELINHCVRAGLKICTDNRGKIQKDFADTSPMVSIF